MQVAFDFGETAPDGGMIDLRRRVREVFGVYRCDWRLTPVQQLVKSIISSQTLDRDSWAAFWRLWEEFGSAEAITAAPLEEIERAIAVVTWPGEKAAWVKAALLQIQARGRGLDLEFLGEASLDEAMTWLQSLPGVGPKVAAAVLNFSPLDRRVLVIDRHVRRVLQRLGLARATDSVAASLARVMAQVPVDWIGADLMELHVRLKRIGQSACRPRETRCSACPLENQCRYAAPLARRRKPRLVDVERPGVVCV